MKLIVGVLTLLQRFLSATGNWRLFVVLRRWTGRLFDRWLPPGSQAETLKWRADADWAMLQQEPLRARALLKVSALTLLALLVWAGFAEIDEVTRGEGRVVPSSQVQVIQSMDGGMVDTIFVREGQLVKAGELVMSIEPTRFVSSLRENQSQIHALKARAARLRAIVEGRPFIPPAEVERDAPDIVLRERQLYESQRAEVGAQIGIAQQQLSQREHELREAQAQYAQAGRAMELTSQEMKATEPLVATGAASEVELLRLKRDISRLRGDREQYNAQIARVQSAIQESQRKISEVGLAFRNLRGGELAETLARLGSLSEGGTALADKVSKTEIRSPVRGVVKRLLINTQGGVVQPGRDVVEIVPLDDTLVVEARIRPRDIAFLRPLQPALVKFTAYDSAIYGGLEARLENIGADTVVEDQGPQRGEAFYIVRVRTNKSTLGPNLPIMPGMVAEVDITTGRKTLLTYLLKPVLRAKAEAFTER
ncbi:MAG: HlyD family type I secretion periplasmic adaptor subunit [Pseudomonadota bacterium]|nr:HlyD family type I secretion periplasmic adaptor subunit [Pseudomonadota bacterium]